MNEENEKINKITNRKQRKIESMKQKALPRHHSVHFISKRQRHIERVEH